MQCWHNHYYAMVRERISWPKIPWIRELTMAVYSRSTNSWVLIVECTKRANHGMKMMVGGAWGQAQCWQQIKVPIRRAREKKLGYAWKHAGIGSCSDQNSEVRTISLKSCLCLLALSKLFDLVFCGEPETRKLHFRWGPDVSNGVAIYTGEDYSNILIVLCQMRAGTVCVRSCMGSLFTKLYASFFPL